MDQHLFHDYVFHGTLTNASANLMSICSAGLFIDKLSLLKQGTEIGSSISGESIFIYNNLDLSTNDLFLITSQFQESANPYFGNLSAGQSRDFFIKLPLHAIKNIYKSKIDSDLTIRIYINRDITLTSADVSVLYSNIELLVVANEITNSEKSIV